MKSRILLFTPSAFIALSAYARLGENPAEIARRYGTPIDTILAGRPTAPHTILWSAQFKYDGYSTTVTFLEGKSAAESIVPDDTKEPVTKADAERLINVIGNRRGKWVQTIEKDNYNCAWVNSEINARATLEAGSLSVSTDKILVIRPQPAPRRN
jgi:hypothetical protein